MTRWKYNKEIFTSLSSSNLTASPQCYGTGQRLPKEPTMHQLKLAILAGPAIVLVAITCLTRSIPSLSDLSTIAPYLIGAALTTFLAVIWFNGRD
jgi:hypothetical protein